MQEERSRVAMKKTHNWSDVVKKRYTRKQIAEFRAEAARELLEMNLRALREMSGVTQAQLSKTAQISQAELSKAERRQDHLISTLRRYVQALGGELRVIADFGDKTIRIVGV